MCLTAVSIGCVFFTQLKIALFLFWAFILFISIALKCGRDKPTCASGAGRRDARHKVCAYAPSDYKLVELLNDTPKIKLIQMS